MLRGPSSFQNCFQQSFISRRPSSSLGRYAILHTMNGSQVSQEGQSARWVSTTRSHGGTCHTDITQKKINERRCLKERLNCNLAGHTIDPQTHFSSATGRRCPDAKAENKSRWPHDNPECCETEPSSTVAFSSQTSPLILSSPSSSTAPSLSFSLLTTKGTALCGLGSKSSTTSICKIFPLRLPLATTLSEVLSIHTSFGPFDLHVDASFGPTTWHLLPLEPKTHICITRHQPRMSSCSCLL